DEEEEDNAISVEVGRAVGEELPDLSSQSDDPFGGPLSNNNDNGDQWSQSHHYTLDPVVSTVVIPLHLTDRAHWVYIYIYLHEARAGFFDSLRKPAGFPSLQAAAKAIIKSVGHNWDA
ncbi:hypothetical protein SLS56_011958, partial [Neofusicoccum ribis]